MATLAPLAFLLALALPAAARPQLPTQSSRVVAYRIEAALDAGEKRLTGRETVTWRNDSPGPVDELWFHLYLNAFKNDRTTLMRERGSGADDDLARKEWGWIDVDAIRTADGVDLKPSMVFMHPDDGNPDDESVMRVRLPGAVPPSASIVVEVEWTARFPEGISARNQTKDGYFLGVQWFPKLGVYEEARDRGKPTGRWGWNCHQFHASSEFYADYGTYDVSLTFPSEYRGRVAATGTHVDQTEAADGRTFTIRYTARDVHDFAWVADPTAYVARARRFEHDTFAGRDPVEEERLSRALGRTREELALSPVEVRLFLRPEHAAQEDRHFAAVFAAIYWFGLWYGRYPYGSLTVVDPPFGSSTGGMEYPMLITGGTEWRVARRKHDPEGVLVHEFGHQFWYGLVGNDEFEHAWLDEGFNTYSTAKILDRVYGPERATLVVARAPIYAHPLVPFPEWGKADPRALLTLSGLRWGRIPLPLRNDSLDGRATVPAWNFALLRDDPLLGVLRDLPLLSFVPRVERDEAVELRARYLRNAKADPLDRKAWEYVDRTSYSINAYSRPALTLFTLERWVNARKGPGTWERVMRTYHERFRFQHPVPEDFLAVANEVSGLDLKPLFDRAVYGSDVIDYGVRVAQSVPTPKPSGIFGPGATGERRTGEPPSGDERKRRLGPHDTKVVVERLGEFVVPVVIEVKWEGVNEPERYEWDGRDRHWTKRWEGGHRLEWVRVDPDRVWLLEADLSNNARRVDPRRAAAFRWATQHLFWVQNVLHFFGGIG